MGVKDVKHVILVLSGKGGVGKSTVSVHLALSLRDMDYKVGILDVDLCGPSIPHLLNIEERDVHQAPEGWMPVYLDNTQRLCAMSIAFLLGSKEDAVIWRGPKKNTMIKQFLSDVNWPQLDFLIVDMPPGTSDEHMTMVENIKGTIDTYAVLVTTPQLISVCDVRREITFCMKTKITILGVIENMSGYVCPNCKECTAIFSTGGGTALADDRNVPFLGSLPLDPEFVNTIAKRCAMESIESETLKSFNAVAQNICDTIKKYSRYRLLPC